MTNEDLELRQWQDEWNALGGEAGFARELVARAARDTRRLWLSSFLEVLAAALSSAFSLSGVIWSHGQPTIVAMTAIILVFNGVWLTRMFSLREGTYRGASSGVDDYVALTRKRLDGDIAFSRFARRATSVLAVLLTPWGVWMFLTHRDAYVAEPWRAVVGFGGVLAILTFIFLSQSRSRKRKVAERARFERLVAERVLR